MMKIEADSIYIANKLEPHWEISEEKFLFEKALIQFYK